MKAVLCILTDGPLSNTVATTQLVIERRRKEGLYSLLVNFQGFISMLDGV
jgi:hypothetical protein